MKGVMQIGDAWKSRANRTSGIPHGTHPLSLPFLIFLHVGRYILQDGGRGIIRDRGVYWVPSHPYWYRISYPLSYMYPNSIDMRILDEHIG